MSRKILNVITSALLFTTFLASSAIITNNNDPQALLDALSSSGSGEHYSGADLAAGTFTNGSNAFGINSGIVLSSGNVLDYSDGFNTNGSNTTSFGTAGHSRLTEMAGFPTYDAARFGFDFQATSNEISFDFVFGSEEYPEFVGSTFNDSFGVFLSDDDGNVRQLVHDNSGESISINSAWMTSGSNGELDGTTGLLHTKASVSAGRNYSIEFAIADAGDSSYDSTVFISQLEGTAPVDDTVDIHGLFVGTNEIKNSVTVLGNKDIGFKGADDAEAVRQKIASSLSNAELDNIETMYGTYTNGTEGGGLSVESVLEELNSQLKAVDDNDIFIFYLGGHGGITESGQHAVVLGDNYISASHLATIFGEYQDVEKWIMIDSCYSGGFWDEFKDIQNISFLSSTDSENTGTYRKSDGRGQFSEGIEEALTFEGGVLKADLDTNGIVDLFELNAYLADYNWWLGLVNDEEFYGFTNDIYLPSDDPNMKVDLSRIAAPQMNTTSSKRLFLSATSDGSAITGTTEVPEPPAVFLMSVALVFIIRRQINNAKS